MGNKLRTKLDTMSNVKKMELDDTLLAVKNIEKLIKESLQATPDIELSYLEDTISKILNDYLYRLKSPTKSDLYLFKTIENLTKNPSLIGETLLTMDTTNLFKETDSNLIYVSNIKNNYKTAIEDALFTIKKSISDEEQQKIKNKELNSSELMLFQNTIKKFLDFFYNKKYDEIIRNGYIRRLVNLIDILDYIGTLKQNNDINNRKLYYAHLEFLGFNYKDNNSDTIKRPSLIDLSNSDFVKNFSNDELTAMCAFYSNRVAKGLRCYNQCLFILDKANIIKKYFENPNYTFDLSNDEVCNFIKQYKLLKITARNYLDTKFNNPENKKYRVSDDTVSEEPDDHFINKFINNFGENYSEEFSSILPGFEHDYKKDLNKSIMLESGTYNAYKTKDQSLEALLFMLLEKNKERNWGIILDDYSDGLPTQNKNNNLLLCVDMKEFNMPLTLHCSYEQIREFFINYTGKPYIPVYKGNEDMFINKEIFSTQIYMKLSKDQRKKLRETAEKCSPKTTLYYKFIKHLQWMSHPKRQPDFIDNQNLFYDLKTGFIYDEADLEK